MIEIPVAPELFEATVNGRRRAHVLRRTVGAPTPGDVAHVREIAAVCPRCVHRARHRVGEPIEVFTLPDSATTRAIERNGLTWAHCNDRRAQIEDAVFVFHVGTVPLDPAARRVKCMMCGARAGEAGGEA